MIAFFLMSDVGFRISEEMLFMDYNSDDRFENPKSSMKFNHQETFPPTSDIRNPRSTLFFLLQ